MCNRMSHSLSARFFLIYVRSIHHHYFFDTPTGRHSKHALENDFEALEIDVSKISIRPFAPP